MKLRIIYHMLAFLLCGCVRNVPDYSITDEALSRNAVIIVRAKDCESTTSRNSVCAKLHFFLANVSKWDLCREGLVVECGNGKFSEYVIKVIPPGKYDLRFISDGSTSSVARYTTDGDNLGVFDFLVEKGTVNYIGDLLSYSKSGKIEVVDNFEQARSFLEKKHPELANKLTKNFVDHWVSTIVKKHLKNI
ncbi:MAG: hypothetical protein LBD75_04705 [Candidatus Peribacteria bacterium]|nr:hypothetical protein [Candidatus Peribacteria bacterium]